MQKKAVDGIVFEGKSARQSMRDAGYSDHSADYPKHTLGEREGVRRYLMTLDKKALKRFGMSLKDKVMEVYLEGLEAETPMDKFGMRYADHKNRGEFADRFARFFGWAEQPGQSQVSKLQQFNFFAVDRQEQDQFNSRFNTFLKKYYSQK